MPTSLQAMRPTLEKKYPVLPPDFTHYKR